MLKKFCRCGKIISQQEKICSKCQEKNSNYIARNNKEAYAKYKSNRTDTREQQFYVSKEWIITRDVVKNRDNGLCKLCNDKGKITFVDTVHHIEELKEAWSIRTSQGNLICLCNRCHYYVHMKYKKSEASKKEMKDRLKRLIDR